MVKRIFQCELRNLRKIKDAKLVDELLKFEDREVIRNYKFGIVYVGEGQTKEEDIFANGTRHIHFPDQADSSGKMPPAPPSRSF